MSEQSFLCQVCGDQAIAADREQDTIDRFNAIYGGGKAQRLRDAGQPNAMPPWAEVYWLGKQVVKCPMDLWVYQEIIWETKPDLIIETGTSGGGSAFFFATLFDLMGLPGRVLTIDKDSYPELCRPHPRIDYLIGDSVSEAIADKVWSAAGPGRRVMVSLDSLHTYEHVAAELALYGPLVSPGCYLVVEDTGASEGPDWATRAAAEFVAVNPCFVVDKSRERHLLTSNVDGWIRRER